MDRVIAVDLGATNIRVGIGENSRSSIDLMTVRTPEMPGSAEDITSLIVDCIRHVTGREGTTDISGIGISAAGPVDQRDGSIIRPPNILLESIPLRGPLEAEFGVPVRIINDCHAGVLGEVCYGGLSHENNAVYITMSTGIGAGIISGGKILLGRNGNAGEIGHFFVEETFNTVCGCGFPGHWEAVSSGHFLPVFFSRWCRKKGISCPDINGLSPEMVFSTIRECGGEFLQFLDDLGRINARGVSDVIVAYEPECIIFDGSVVRENNDLIIPFIASHIDRFLPLPRMALSSLGGRAPILGAAVIAHGYDTVIGNLLPEQYR